MEFDDVWQDEWEDGSFEGYQRDPEEEADEFSREDD